MTNKPCKSPETTSKTTQSPVLPSFSNLAFDSKNLKLSFSVSRNEEHVRLKVLYGDHEFDLGERVHHYPLLLLVRLRAEDLRRGVPTDSAGWVAFPQLSKMLGMDATHLTIQLFRLRKQISDSIPVEHPLSLIERRRGELRAAAMSVSIEQGATIQVEQLFGSAGDIG